MRLVIQRILLLAMFVFSLTACSSEPERQWYKAGVSYTMAEFQRDQAACTKDKVLDEECMKERGWIAISIDKDTIGPMKGGLPTSPKAGRYGPGSAPTK